MVLYFVVYKNMNRTTRFQRARIFKALGNPARLALVDQLCQGERCVCELQPETGVELPTVSRHLAVLREAGIVKERRQGTNIYYSLRMACVRNFMACIDAFLTDEARQALTILTGEETGP